MNAYRGNIQTCTIDKFIFCLPFYYMPMPGIFYYYERIKYYHDITNSGTFKVSTTSKYYFYFVRLSILVLFFRFLGSQYFF